MNRVSALTIAFAVSACGAQAQLAHSPWPDYGGGYANQHRSDYVGPSGTLSILWDYDLSALGTSSFERGYHQPILLPGGEIVFNTLDTSNDMTVALNPDGTLKWSFNNSDLSPWLAADVNGQVYALRKSYSSSSGGLRAFDFNGNYLWDSSITTGSTVQTGPAIDQNGTIYAARDFGSVNSIETDGSQNWQAASMGTYVNPAISTTGTIYVGGSNLTSMEADGSINWTYSPSPSTSTFLSPAIDDNGVIYAGVGFADKLAALLPDGSELWSRSDLGGAPSIGLNGDIYVVPESGILHALDAADGSTLWTYATGKTDYYNSEGVTIDADGNLYMSNDQGVVMSLTPGGQLRWSLDLAPNDSGFIGTSAPVIGEDGTLYVVGGNTGKVFAIIPEPTSLVMLGLGGLVLARGRRR